jgi:hypothetical protein
MPREVCVDAPAQALQAIRAGNEQASFESLLTARSGTLSIPQESLKTLCTTKQSARWAALLLTRASEC